jgi:hypothetical protein
MAKKELVNVAAMITGEPRFCEELDLFISNLIGHATITWFFFLWKVPITGNIYHKGLIAPYWQNVDYDKAYDKIRTNLTNRRIHQIGALEIVDPEPYELDFNPRNVTNCCARPANVWGMWQAWHHGYKQIESSGKQFDLVLRIRGDISLSEPLNLKKIKRLIDDQPNRLIVPNNRWHGYSRWICDNMAISSMQNMAIYCDVIKSIPSFQEEGFIFHAETCLAEHLHRNGIEVVRHNFDIGIRHLDNGAGAGKHGRWA